MTIEQYWRFFWAGLIRQGQTGAIIPSQRFLVDKMIAPIPADYSGQVIELGAGNGALTMRLAAKCPRARIAACEINPVLAKDLREKIHQDGLEGRVGLALESAERLLKRLREENALADFIVSGIPLAHLGRTPTMNLIHSIHSALRPGGIYIQFQYSLLDRQKIRASFSKLRTVPVPLNLPPAVVYFARK